MLFSVWKFMPFSPFAQPKQPRSINASHRQSLLFRFFMRPSRSVDKNNRKTRSIPYVMRITNKTKENAHYNLLKMLNSFTFRANL